MSIINPTCKWVTPLVVELKQADGEKWRCVAAKYDRQSDPENCFYRQCYFSAKEQGGYCYAHSNAKSQPISWADYVKEKPPTAGTIPGPLVLPPPLTQVININTHVKRDNARLISSLDVVVAATEEIKNREIICKNDLETVKRQLQEKQAEFSQTLEVEKGKSTGVERENIARIGVLQRQLEDLRRESEGYREEDKKCQSQITESKSVIAALQTELADLRTTTQLGTSQRDALVTELQNENATLKRQAQELKNEQEAKLAQLTGAGESARSALQLELKEIKEKGEAAAQEQKNKIGELEGKLASAENELKELKEAMENKTKELASVQSALDTLRTNSSNIGLDLQQCNSDADKLRAELKTNQTTLTGSAAKEADLINKLEAKQRELEEKSEQLEAAQASLEVLGWQDGSGGVPAALERATKLLSASQPASRPVETKTPVPATIEKAVEAQKNEPESKTKTKKLTADQLNRAIDAFNEAKARGVTTTKIPAAVTEGLARLDTATLLGTDQWMEDNELTTTQGPIAKVLQGAWTDRDKLTPFTSPAS